NRPRSSHHSTCSAHSPGPEAIGAKQFTFLSARSQSFSRSQPSTSWRAEGSTPCSAAVVLLQVFGDHLGVGFIDRRSEGLNHLGDGRIPNGGRRERGVHQHVVQAVTGRTVPLDLLEPRCLLELNWLLIGRGRRANRCRQGGGNDE